MSSDAAAPRMEDSARDPLDMRNYRIEQLPVREKSRFEKALAAAGAPLALAVFVVFAFLADLPFLQGIDPANPSFVITGLEDGASYFVVVTALDTEGYESGYSNSVCARIQGTAQPCAGGWGGGGGGSGAGGGSGGGGGCCFIGVLMTSGGE